MSPRKPGRWFDRDKLLKLIDLGWTNKEIAEAHETNMGWKPTPSAVSRHLRDVGIPPRKMSHKDLIWWTIRPEHQHNRIYYWLVALDKERKGAPLTPQERSQAKLLRDTLIGMGIPLVVDYQPDVYPEDGFVFVPASPGDDIVRRPRETKGSN